MAVLNKVKYNRENSHAEYTRNSKRQLKKFATNARYKTRRRDSLFIRNINGDAV